MSIEFHCEHCFQKVVTPDSTAGKKGRCPSCQEVVVIPTSSQADHPKSKSSRQIGLHDLLDEAPAQRSSGSPGQEGRRAVTMSNAGWRETEELARWGEQTQESKRRRFEEAREDARRALSVPAVGLMVCAALGMFLTFGYGFVLALTTAEWVQVENFDPGMIVVHLMLIIANLAVNSMLVIGANHMRMARNYSTAIAGAVLGILPLPLNLICPISAPFAAWALVLLASRDIRMTFRRM